ncbi:DUF1353 domain-containing protein [Aeromonas sp.]|uniref:DUF1353 domain-containing protein n=1 Tax=Aeromonas sp. TaxID=647 RepID=UPI00258A4512|nr:DUF1353 domain-containing protein [Aeromonas sp.]MCX7128071.1 DUF1353 domain-containing protein [Aeromonas sp.]
MINTSRILLEPKGNEWRLAKDLLIDINEPRIRLYIPEGFITDLASVPRAIWSFVPPYGLHTRAAVIHDWLYRSKLQITRAEADKVFLEIMQQDEVDPVLAKLMYRAVRMFGSASYKAR